MRNIKFRAWEEKDKSMMFSSGLNIEIISLCNNPFNLQGYNRDSSVVFMQFTGLKDKNGKEIHEGDIVSTLEDGNLEVIFQDGMFGCITCRPQSNENGTEYYDEFVPLNDLIDVGYWGSTDGFKKPVFTLEVIGNIYENPELLKEA